MAERSEFSRLSQKQIAEALDVTSRTVRDWEKDEDFPRNDDGSYDLKACIRWFVARSTGDELDLDRERARLAKEQADKHAIENAARRGELLEVSVVANTWQEIFTAIRARVLSQPTKLAAELAAMTDANRIRDRLTDEAHQILGEAAAYRPGHAVSDDPATCRDGVDDPPSASEADGQSVGGRRAKAQ